MHSVFNIEQIEQLYYLAQQLAELAISCNIIIQICIKLQKSTVLTSEIPVSLDICYQYHHKDSHNPEKVINQFHLTEMAWNIFF